MGMTERWALRVQKAPRVPLGLPARMARLVKLDRWVILVLRVLPEKTDTTDCRVMLDQWVRLALLDLRAKMDT